MTNTRSVIASRSRTDLRLVLTACIALFTGQAMALENSLKAAFLYKFAGFVEWPATAFQSPDAPIIIAVIGAEAVAENLAEMVAGHTARGRPITVRQFATQPSAEDVHILFIGRDAADRLNALAADFDARPTLLVTDTPHALERGSMINFVRVDNRLRFEIALDSAERRGLRLSSRLLGVALDVRREAP